MTRPPRPVRVSLGRALQGARLAGANTQAAALQRTRPPAAEPRPVPSVAAGPTPPAPPAASAPPRPALEDDAALQRAFQEAELRGRQAGERTWRLRLGTALAALEKAVQALDTTSADALEAIEREACALAIAVAEHVLHDALQEGRHRITETVAQAFRAVHERLGTEPVRLYLHPEDVVALRERCGRALAERLERVEIKAEANLARGDVRVETNHGVLLAGASEQLRQIRRRWLEQRERAT
ncbi:MAG: hypothetical protein D6776_04835 [Planctomycetota bacterium]|nr:MAG: hypothetical protein D6776_04835 [Planctomycetota bacterium]